MASIAYSPNWQSEALRLGKDVNSPEFASYRTMDQSKPSTGGGGGSSTDYIQRATDQIRTNMQPGIDQLNTGINNTGTAYEQYRTSKQNSVAPLEERYKAVLDSIKGNQTAAENRQTAVTSAELGRRGITSDSGVGAQEITNALQPVTAQYAGMSANTGLEQAKDVNAINDSIAQSFIGQNTDTNSIRGALASLYGNAATGGASTGASLYGTDTQAELNRQQMAQQAQQAAMQQALSREQLDFTKSTDARDFAEQQRQYNNAQANKGGSDGGLGDLFKQLGLGSTAPKATAKTVVGRLADGRYLWSDGSAGWSGGK